MFTSAGWLRIGALIYDLGIVALAFIGANAIAFGPEWDRLIPDVELRTIAFVLLGAVSIFATRLNRGLWRYASIPDMAAIVKAATLTVVVYTLATFLISRGAHVSRLATGLSWIFIIFGMGAGRIAYRLFKETFVIPRMGAWARVDRKSLVYPFSDTTEDYIRAVRRQPEAGRSIAGIIGATKRSSSRDLRGYRVLGQPSSIEKVVNDHAKRGITITELIVTDPAVTGRELTALLEHCNRAGIGIKRLPGLLSPGSESSDGPIAPNPVRLDDLLGRAVVKVDQAAVRSLLAGKVVLVTGAGGSIGSELCEQIAGFGPARIVLVDHSEHNLYQVERKLCGRHPEVPLVQLLCDVRDSLRVEAIMQREAPDVVFHAAAIKHVPIAERNPLETIKTNALGTATVARAATKHGVKSFVLISTDKAVNPSNVMGTTKRAAELYCQALDLAVDSTIFRVVRFGNVLGSAGSVVPLFQEQIARGGPVTVTDPEVSRYFMTIPEAVSLILEAVSDGASGGKERGAILVLDMGKPVRIADMARRLIQLAGYAPDRDIKITYTGLRPGEKLEEELISPSEDDIIQRHEGYFVARTRTIETGTVVGWFEELAKACRDQDHQAAMRMLRTIVPSFVELENGRSPIATPADAPADAVLVRTDDEDALPSRRLH